MNLLNNCMLTLIIYYPIIIGQTIKMNTPTNHQTNSAMYCPNCNKVLLDKPKLFVCQSKYSHEIWKQYVRKLSS